ncbi:hypothetical protein L6164_022086 [Bauhinia variegata]|uniref:Uncharacterized protein n=1 Tax=Bauhinia variegata TaxID=167791 RepID=A0ACB9MFX1_BAUVA|nr:hypothetical protein L6164_022086 [Bauhinia variegata]
MEAAVISRQLSGSSGWRSMSVREMWKEADAFRRSSQRVVEDDEEELKWAAIERLPTYDRMRKGILKQVTGSGRVVHDDVDVAKLGSQDKQLLMESILKVAEQDNERFLRRLRGRIDRVGIEIPKIEVRYEHLSIEGEAHVGTRALPTLLNTTLNTVEEILGKVGLSPSKKRVIKILQDVSGIIKPSRMTLLLGHPGAGKTTLLKALAAKLDNDLKGISGGQKKRITTGEMLVGNAKAFFMDEISTGLDTASRFFKQLLAFFGIHQMALSLFRFIAGASRTQIIANSFGFLVLMIVFVLGDDIQSWLIWAYYISPMMYGQNAIAINEFLDDRWSTRTTNSSQPTVGKTLLHDRGLFLTESWYWISIGALFGFSILFNILFIAALTYLNPIGDNKHMILNDDSECDRMRKETSNPDGIDMPVRNNNSTDGVTNPQTKRGMVLPFQPLSLAFNHVNYYVDMPQEMKSQGVEESRLHLLKDVSGAFRPGVLTALVGVSGAGKTTLMDVLAGRKTSGYIEGSISISGYPKNQATFARISGYCEQNDIHSPCVTVYESLLFSAWLRLSSDVNKETRKMFVEEVMGLVELNPLRNALVGLPGVDGLSTEQRKRLTIAVELVANPSIIFMDEPTSGLDARAAAIVMRTVRNTVDTGRTVVCTIHQPSIDIFEAFDELLLLKRGGRVIYAGPLGHHSHKLIEYFEAIPGVPKIKEGNNPATWMLEVSTSAVEAQLNIDFADVYANSELYRRNQQLIEELSTPPPGSEDLHFPTKYYQNFITQCLACFWKQHWSYWRNSQFNAVRFFTTISIGISFGVIFWSTGEKLDKQQDLINLFGATYAAILFLGANNCSAVQPVVSIERTVFYRERAAGMYSEMPYALAQLAIEMIYVAIQTIIYTLLLYSMIGYNWDAGKFFYFYYFVFMCFTYFSLYGMTVIALTLGQQIAAILMAFFMNFWNLFSGFLIPRPLIPVWWRWYYWASPIAWTIYGVFASQFGDVKTMLEIPGDEPKAVNVYLKDSLGFDHDFIVPVVLAHVGWVILFMLVFAYCIKFLNFQER